MTQQTSKRILVAPLDWGLGHTTRCVPVIRAIEALGHKVIFAGTPQQQALIKNFYNDIEFVSLEGYGITYSPAEQPGKLQPLQWLPRISRAIKKEHNWLLQNAARLQIDGIISDNRYGLYHSGIPCVILTHQLCIQTGMGSLANRVMQKLHYKLLERFGEVWVPDIEGEWSLAGDLSQTAVRPANTTYIGWLSQFETPLPANEQRHILVLLSGPEPQRTMLENKLLEQLSRHTGKVIFVAGKPGGEPKNVPAHIAYHEVASGKVLLELIMNAHTVICRSGYSTLMDLQLCRKPAILIPTPGQTEQEYLARHLSARKGYLGSSQAALNWPEMPEPGAIPPPAAMPESTYERHKAVVERWCRQL